MEGHSRERGLSRWRGAGVQGYMGLRRGAAAWGCTGAQQRGAAQERSSVGLRRGAAA